MVTRDFDGVITRPCAGDYHSVASLPLQGNGPSKVSGDVKTSDNRDFLPMSVPMASEPFGHTLTPKRPSKMASSQSLNHLLNFTLPPRQTHSQSFPRRGKKSSTHGVWNKESEYQPYQPSHPAPNWFPSRICERPISIRHESHRRLYGPFRGSGHVCSPYVCVSLFFEPPPIKASSNGKIYYRSSSRERQPTHLQQVGRPTVQMRA